MINLGQTAKAVGMLSLFSYSRYSSCAPEHLCPLWGDNVALIQTTLEWGCSNDSKACGVFPMLKLVPKLKEEEEKKKSQPP